MRVLISPTSSKDKSKPHSITHQLNPDDGALLLIDYLYKYGKINQITYEKIQKEYKKDS